MKTLLEMAREAGLLTIGTADGSEAVYTWPKGITEELERFAELVRADEREECAKKAETLGAHPGLNVFAGGPDWYKHGKEIATAIRARTGEQK